MDLDKIKDKLIADNNTAIFIDRRMKAIEKQIKKRNTYIRLGHLQAVWEYVYMHWESPDKLIRNCGHSHLNGSPLDLSKGCFNSLTNQYDFPSENAYCFCTIAIEIN